MIVDFSLKTAPEGRMTERLMAIARTRNYWNSLRRDGGLPERADIDPRALPGALANIFLIERVVPGITRFRLAGAVLSEVMGMDVRGMPFLSIIEPAERSALAARVDQVFLDPSILELTLESAASVGRARLNARVTLLPVRSLRGVDLALGCLETEGLAGRAPRRFRVLRTVHDRIGDAPAASEPVAPGFAEPATSFAPARGGLRLVYSSDHKVSGGGETSE